ncbi:MAG: nucleotidyltransferase family protein [Gammaproteobacteria bacterium]|nr:nucleotidyltransferase family protein [Gammaproteobacteria bacterium]MYF53986.1 nucleotidyltransferase family protein [Gammaproteobacteria bacterium]MYK43414.1 nucleotidyltransferase family protein [Gammaproteobacteria bacterium]
MKAMILAAGFGTRLLPLTKTIPKPLILFRNEPLIVHQIRALKRAGVEEIVVNVHHLAEQIMSVLGSGNEYGVKIAYSEEREILDTGGGIKKALPLLGQSPFIVLNGDVWTDFAFAQICQRTTDYAHLILKQNDGSSMGRDFAFEGENIQRFAVTESHTHTFCGISLIHPSVFSGIIRTKFSLTRDLLFDLVQQKKVTAEVFDGVWFDIGTKTSLHHVQKILAT